MMRNKAAAIYKSLTGAGVDLLKMANSVRGIPCFLRDSIRWMRQVDRRFPRGFPHVFMGDRYENGGRVSGVYFHQDLYVAKKVFEAAPEDHLDVGSRTDGFVAHLASFRSVEVIDIRRLDSTVENISFIQCDFMQPLPEHLKGARSSVSCLHALEHFGLGRYGDPICPDGDLKGFENLYQLLKLGGTLYFSVPLGPQRVEFNAQRVYSLKYLLELIEGRFGVESFAFIDDRGDIHEEVELTDELIGNNAGCFYGCGIFTLSKLPVE
jgi:SAM-dependent methyltransferase